MADPMILIAGSADRSRDDYDPPLRGAEAAPTAAKQIGAELARSNYRIAVYSAASAYIEADEVRGFVAHAKKGAQSRIEVRYPHTEPKSAQFPETSSHPRLFASIADPNTSWEASFYASLRDAHGVILIGGGRSAHALGYMALANQVPVFPLACFGGAAEAVWRAIRPGVDLPTEQDMQRMNPAQWSEDHAKHVVPALSAQRKTKENRIENTEQRRVSRGATYRMIAALLVVLAAIALMVWGWTLPEPRDIRLFLSLLFVVGPVAGAGSALVTSVWRAPTIERSPIATAIMGFVAGLVMSVLYLLAQATTAGDPSSIKGLAIVVAMATGLLAGFVVDQVMRDATSGRLRLDRQARD